MFAFLVTGCFFYLNNNLEETALIFGTQQNQHNSTVSTPPAVVYVYPEDKQKYLPVDSDVRVKFSKPIDPSTLNSSTLYVKKGNIALSGRISYNPETNEAYLTPYIPPYSTLAYGSDYKIIVTRGIKDTGGIQLPQDYEFSFSTMDTAGIKDSGFGNNGIVLTNFNDNNQGDYEDYSYTLAIQQDGKIVIGGLHLDSINQTSEGILIRYNIDGSPDITFGTGGKMSLGFRQVRSIHSMALLNNDEIIVTGSANDSFSFFPFLGKVNSNIFTTYAILGAGKAESVAIQNDGRIVIAGQNTIGKKIFIARLNSGLSLDLSFNGFGFYSFHINDAEPVPESRAHAVAIQNDGKIIVAGSSLKHNSYRFALARFNSDGSPDPGFGNNGMRLIDEVIGEIFSLKLLKDGKMLVAGYVNDGWYEQFVIARLLPDGSLDRNFGTNGIVKPPIGFGDRAYAMEIQDNGKILVAGSAFIENYPRITVIRLLPDGNLDPSFGNQGKFILPDLTGSASSIAIQKDRKIVLTGYTTDTFKMVTLRLK